MKLRKKTEFQKQKQRIIKNQPIKYLKYMTIIMKMDLIIDILEKQLMNQKKEVKIINQKWRVKKIEYIKQMDGLVKEE